MVKFTEDVGAVEDHIFVEKDPAVIYRDLRNMLVEEFDIDRIEEGKMEFNVEKPKDRVRMYAFKEKSPHTVIAYNFSLKAKSPKDYYKQQRPDDILKSRIAISAEVITVYPGGDPISWLPKGEGHDPVKRKGMPGLKAEHKSRFQRSKLYEILVGIWYNKFYSKEIHTYQEEAMETMKRAQNLLRERLGVQETIKRTGASHYDPPW